MVWVQRYISLFQMRYNYIDLVLVKCWANVASTAGGLILNHHWINECCLVGYVSNLFVRQNIVSLLHLLHLADQ